MSIQRSCGQVRDLSRSLAKQTRAKQTRAK
jgi:hypothetical protein